MQALISILNPTFERCRAALMLPMHARTLRGEPVYGKVPVFWAAQLSDPDGDGVMGVCDLCPNIAALPASVDGCL